MGLTDPSGDPTCICGYLAIVVDYWSVSLGRGFGFHACVEEHECQGRQAKQGLCRLSWIFHLACLLARGLLAVGNLSSQLVKIRTLLVRRFTKVARSQPRPRHRVFCTCRRDTMYTHTALQLGNTSITQIHRRPEFFCEFRT